MGIKRNVAAVIGGFLISCHSAMAGQIYNIDSTQSWVSAYAPTWAPSSGAGGFVFSIDQNVSTPAMPTWQLQWSLTAFVLSGSFVGATEWSPWAPGVGRFTISQGHFNAGIPSPEMFSPISSFSFYQSSGSVDYAGGPCAIDPYYGPPPPGYSCSGWSTGAPPYLAGMFDGKTLDILGGTGGMTPLFSFTTYVGLTPPDSVDPSLFPQFQPYAYKIVANAVPEPSTIPLVLVGLAVAYQIINRRKHKPLIQIA